jgi:lycopene beta-cyclase
MFSRNPTLKVDYVFSGAGASATLLLMSMAQRGLLKRKKIVILDPDTKSINDKTYCFWSLPDEPITLQCGHLISHSWDTASVNRKQSELLFPMHYNHIPSSAVYKELQCIAHEYGIEHIQASVLEFENTKDGIIITTDNGTWLANTVFDSRPPQYEPLQKNEVHLLQSFIGFIIETDTPLTDSTCLDLMDFEVDQLEWTQFVYILPLASNKVLVELTRFGKTPITKLEAEPILNHYIYERFGNFKILDVERGCIPMSTAKIKPSNLAKVIAIGGRAGAIKPSTGYAFKNMFNHVEQLAESLLKNTSHSQIRGRSRFKFYDRLLLLILGFKPTLGKTIFNTLFQRNKILNVLKFLDEKTSLYQDLKILSTLPFKPFILAWCWDVYIRFKPLFMPLSILILSLVLWVLQTFFSPTIYIWIELGILLLGLFIVGIPHGAVDHLLENNNLKSPVNLKFIFSYLFTAAGFFLLWLMTPNLAILSFLVYSIWHFGQSDVKEWLPRNKNPLKNWLWGAILLGIILFSHIIETNLILVDMGVFLIQLDNNIGILISRLLIFIALVWGLLEKKTTIIISCAMLAVGTQLSLITAFGLYFIGQHSLNSWLHLKIGLNTNNIKLFSKALPFNIGAFLLFATLLFCLENKWLNAFNGKEVTAFFVFISCISFPHVIAMHKFYQKIFKEAK